MLSESQLPSLPAGFRFGGRYLAWIVEVGVSFCWQQIRMMVLGTS